MFFIIMLLRFASCVFFFGVCVFAKLFLILSDLRCFFVLKGGNLCTYGTLTGSCTNGRIGCRYNGIPIVSRHARFLSPPPPLPIIIMHKSLVERSFCSISLVMRLLFRSHVGFGCINSSDSFSVRSHIQPMHKSIDLSQFIPSMHFITSSHRFFFSYVIYNLCMCV